MARRNAAPYSVSVLDRLSQRAEARVERIQRVRELGGLPPIPEVTPDPLWSSGYQYMNDHSPDALRSPQYGERTRISMSYAQEALFRGLMRNIPAFQGGADRVHSVNLWDYDDMYEDFKDTEGYDALCLQLGAMDEQQYNKRQLKRQLKKGPIRNENAKFMLDSDY